MLNMYLQCLKNLKRRRDLIRIGLQIVANITRNGQATKIYSLEPFAEGAATPMNYFKEIIDSAKALDSPMSVPSDSYFSNIFLDPYTSHIEDQDGFCLMMNFNSLISENFQCQEIQVQITSTEAGRSYEIWLAAENERLVRPGVNRVLVVSKVINNSE